MEKRDRQAREASLKELKRLRVEGGLKKVDSEEDELNAKDFMRVHSSDEEFIEYVPDELKSKSSVKSDRQVNQPSLMKDEFFNSLLEQLDSDDAKEKIDDIKSSEVASMTMTSVMEMDWDEPLPDFPIIPSTIVKPMGGLVTSEIDHLSSAIDILDTKKPPISQDVLLFYWIDAHERPNGTVFLFGRIRDPKTSSLRSASVTVKNIQRNIYLLPRLTVASESNGEHENSMEEVKKELEQLLSKAKIPINSVSIRKVSRKYAFEVPGIPTEADWIKLSYNYSLNTFPSQSGRTFSHVFGSTSSALESFLIKRNVMGPCWLAMKPSPMVKKGVSWCQEEYEIEEPKHIVVLPSEACPPTPDLCVLSLSLKTIPNNGQHEIIAAAGVLFSSVPLERNASSDASGSFSVVREDSFKDMFSSSIQSAYGLKGKLEVVKNERSLLSFLLAVIHRWDPDAIIGHNFYGFEMSILLQRLKISSVPNWSKVGRLNWSNWPKMSRQEGGSNYVERQIFSGRLICDTYLGAREHVKSKNYALATLVESQLNVKMAVQHQHVIKDEKQLALLAKETEQSSYLQAQLAFRLQLLQLSKQLTNIAGNLWSRTLMGARAERNEYLFLHEFHVLKYILPDKKPYNSDHVQEEDSDDEHQTTTSKRKPMYSGGLVLEPKRGLYMDTVMLLDFNSLYPSIIQEYNICFTTVDRSNQEEIPAVPSVSLPKGVLPKIIYTLVQRRKQVKSLMKNQKLTPEEYGQLNTRQQALKLTANSMYGCLGFTHSRFHARPLASLITAKGREILQSTVEVARNHCGLDVIYGDTDSVMINTGLTLSDIQEAKQLAGKLKKAVNEKYKCLEIELDGLFKRLLLLKKKKYAALVVQEDGLCKLETKGLDMVRRDWCPLSVSACNFCLTSIMECASVDGLAQIIQKYLHELKQSLQSKILPTEQFVISKNLTKDPSLYADVKGQPHVSVALRMRERGEAVQSGNTIQYVMCVSSGSNQSDRAFHPDELSKDPTLAIDFNWYVQQQLIPPLGRICEFVPGVDGVFLASCFGLDTKKYQPHSSGPRMGGEKFGECQALVLKCDSCEKKFDFLLSGLLKCPHCLVQLHKVSAYCQVLQQTRKIAASLYEGWVECEECRHSTRLIGMFSQRCAIDDCHGTVKAKVLFSY